MYQVYIHMRTSTRQFVDIFRLCHRYAFLTAYTPTKKIVERTRARFQLTLYIGLSCTRPHPVVYRRLSLLHPITYTADHATGSLIHHSSSSHSLSMIGVASQLRRLLRREKIQRRWRWGKVGTLERNRGIRQARGVRLRSLFKPHYNISKNGADRAREIRSIDRDFSQFLRLVSFSRFLSLSLFLLLSLPLLVSRLCLCAVCLLLRLVVSLPSEPGAWRCMLPKVVLIGEELGHLWLAHAAAVYPPSATKPLPLFTSVWCMFIYRLYIH